MAARRTVTAEGGENTPAEGVDTIGFGTGRGGVGGSGALWAGRKGKDTDFESARLLVHQLALLVFVLASCSPSDLYASYPSAPGSLLGYIRHET